MMNNGYFGNTNTISLSLGKTLNKKSFSSEQNHRINFDLIHLRKVNIIFFSRGRR